MPAASVIVAFLCGGNVGISVAGGSAGDIGEMWVGDVGVCGNGTLS